MRGLISNSISGNPAAVVTGSNIVKCVWENGDKRTETESKHDIVKCTLAKYTAAFMYKMEQDSGGGCLLSA